MAVMHILSTEISLEISLFSPIIQHEKQTNRQQMELKYQTIRLCKHNDHIR